MLIAAPGLSGFIAKVEARLQGRRGPRILQPDPQPPAATIHLARRPDRLDTPGIIHEAAGGSTPKSAVNETAALDWAGASNLNTCEDPHDVDAAFDRGEEHVGIAVIALVYNNPDTATVLPRVAKALASPRPETRRQGLLAMMHTARLHGRVDETTLGLLKELLDDRSPIGGGYEVRGTAAQTVEDLQAFLPRRTLPNWVNDFTNTS